MSNLHLLSNHLPIIGTFLGIVLLIIALLKPNLKTALSAYLILIISGVGGLIAYLSGESAEHQLEKVKGISHQVIHIHEQFAEKTLFFIFLLAALSLVGFWAERVEWFGARKLQIGALIVGIVVFILFVFTGYLGGQISHGG